MGPQVASPCVIPGQSLRGLARLGVLAGQPVVDPCTDESLRRRHPLSNIGEPLAMVLASKPLGEPFCWQVEQACTTQPLSVHTVLYWSAV